jgi:hypothetical protein
LHAARNLRILIVLADFQATVQQARTGVYGESQDEREADLRALQSDQAERRHTHHLQAQP